MSRIFRKLPLQTRQQLRFSKLGLLVAVCAALSLPMACGRKSAQKGEPGGTSATSSSASGPTSPPPAEIWKEFSGEKAFEHTRKLVELGPHPAGSEALEQARKYIIQTVEQSGWKIEPQQFRDETPRGTITFTNLIARFQNAKQASTQRIIIASHYDTKLFDTIRFVGASDGGSSTGALIELARVLALDPEMARQIELVFFDGEEAFAQFTATDGLYGSRYYARTLRESKRNAQFRFGILWDMIGDKNLTITLPPDSPPQLARDILESADALGCRQNFSYLDRQLLDDHIPLIQSHIPTIDLIDFDYPAWHTADDTLDKISAESLQKVGTVTLYSLRKQLLNK